MSCNATKCLVGDDEPPPSKVSQRRWKFFLQIASLLPVLCGSVSFSPRRWEHFWIFQVNALCDPSTGAIIQKIVQDKYRSLPCTIMWTHSWRIHVKPPSDCRNPRIYVKLPGNRMSNLYGQSTRKSWAILEVAQDPFVWTSAHALLNPTSITRRQYVSNLTRRNSANKPLLP